MAEEKEGRPFMRWTLISGAWNMWYVGNDPMWNEDDKSYKDEDKKAKQQIPALEVKLRNKKQVVGIKKQHEQKIRKKLALKRGDLKKRNGIGHIGRKKHRHRHKQYDTGNMKPYLV
jgi:hypothetical protein